MDSLKREVDQFKRELDSVGYYCSKLQDANVELFAIGVQLYEVGGTNYDKEQSGNGNPNKTPKLNLMMEEERLIEAASFWEKRINYCRNILNGCSATTKQSLIRYHVLNEKWTDVAGDFDYSRNGYKKIVDKEIAEVLKSATGTK